MTGPIEIHYWPTPNGHKVTIACEEMGLPYEIVPVNLGRGEQFKPDFLAISPNNRMPAIIDPDGPDGAPISIFESAAILQYLGRKSGQFYPPEERGRVRVDEWLIWQAANFGPNAGQRNHFRNYAPSVILDQRQIAYGAIRYTNEVHRLYGVLDTQLQDKDYIAGDYSIADMAAWPWVAARSSPALDLEEFPALKVWQARVEAREAVQRAMAKARDFVSAAPTGQSPESQSARAVLFGQRARR